MRKDTNLQIRFNELQKEFYKQKADEYGLTMSEFFKLQTLMFFKLRDFEPDVFNKLMSDYKKDIDRI